MGFGLNVIERGTRGKSCGRNGGKLEDTLIISGPIVSNKPYASFCQSFNDFAFNPSRDADALEGAVDGLCAIESARAAFLEEVCWVG